MAQRAPGSGFLRSDCQSWPLSSRRRGIRSQPAEEELAAVFRLPQIVPAFLSNRLLHDLRPLGEKWPVDITSLVSQVDGPFTDVYYLHHHEQRMVRPFVDALLHTLLLGKETVDSMLLLVL